MNDSVISERAEEIRRIACQHGAHRVCVFGSLRTGRSERLK
jgi:hypothetical protein